VGEREGGGSRQPGPTYIHTNSYSAKNRENESEALTFSLIYATPLQWNKEKELSNSTQGGALWGVCLLEKSAPMQTHVERFASVDTHCAQAVPSKTWSHSHKLLTNDKRKINFLLSIRCNRFTCPIHSNAEEILSTCTVVKVPWGARERRSCTSDYWQ